MPSDATSKDRLFTSSTVLKLLVSSSKPNETLSVFLIKIAKSVLFSLIRSQYKAIATDSEGHELRVNDNVKEIDNEVRSYTLSKPSKTVLTHSQGPKGRVLHTYQSFFAFLHNRDITENGGVFVTRVRSLASQTSKGNIVRASADLSKMNPVMIAPTVGMVGSGAMGRGPRDRDIGTTVTVVKGPHKGYTGTIKDTNGPIARVELRTGNKVITIEKEKLHRR